MVQQQSRILGPGGIEVVARVEGHVAVEIVGRTVDLVGAGFDSDVHHHARLGAVVRLRLFLGVEFLDGVERKRAGGRAGDARVIHHRLAVVDVVIVGAVDDEIVVVGAHAVGREGVETSARVALHARMQRQEILEVASLQRQFIDGLIGEHAVEYGVGGFGQRSRICNFDHFGDAPRPQHKIDIEFVAHFHLNAVTQNGFERGGLGFQGIEARLDVGGHVIAGGVGLQSARHVRAEIFDGHLGAGNRRVGGVRHLTADTSAVGLRQQQRGQ